MQRTPIRALGPALVAAAATPLIAQDDIFVDSKQVVGQDEPNGIALGVGDIDGDGDIDALTGSYVQPSVAYINDGDGFFTSTGQDLPAFLAARVLPADFDADGDLDFFVLSHSLQSRVLFNDGTGFFTAGEQDLGSLQAHGADAADVDGDGDIDLFVTNVNGHVNTVAFNDGTGVFTYSEEDNPPSARGVALADLDGDGDLDAFLAQTGSGLNEPDPGNRVLLNDGTGSFTDTGQLLGSTYSVDVRLADLDADGDVDAFVGNASLFDNDPANTVWLNDGDANFSDSGQMLGAGDTNGLAIADVDGDGDTDVLSVNAFAENILWLNDGSAGFTNAQALGAPDAPNAEAALADLDADGDHDAFVLGAAVGGEGVYFNVTVTCAADMNADGELDLLDFFAFQDAWLAQDPIADCDADGAFTVLDFLCYQDLFQAGCD